MTVTSQATKVTTAGNGSATTFSFSPIVIFASTDLEVVTTVVATGVETAVTEGTGASNWSLDLTTFPATGSITYPADEVTPLESTHTITVKRVLTLEQQTDLNNQGGYFPDVQETQFDKQVMIDLQQQELIERSLRFPVSYTGSISAETGAPTALGYLRANSGGTALEWAAISVADAAASDATPQVVSTSAGAAGVGGDFAREDHAHQVVLADIGGIGAATADTLTNKTLDADGTGNTISNIGSSEVKSELISGQSEVTIATGDSVILGDADDSGNLKRDTVQGILDLVPDTITLGTEQSTSSGSSVTFGSIPAGTKRITIMFEGVSLTTSTDLLVTIGDAGGLETSGYVASSASSNGAGGGSSNNSTAAFNMEHGSTHVFSGHMTLTLKDAANFTWVASHIGSALTTHVVFGGGHKSLSAELTQVSISGGTFDAGSINISYED